MASPSSALTRGNSSVCPKTALTPTLWSKCTRLMVVAGVTERNTIFCRPLHLWLKREGPRTLRYCRKLWQKKLPPLSFSFLHWLPFPLTALIHPAPRSRGLLSPQVQWLTNLFWLVIIRWLNTTEEPGRAANAMRLATLEGEGPLILASSPWRILKVLWSSCSLIPIWFSSLVHTLRSELGVWGRDKR